LIADIFTVVVAEGLLIEVAKEMKRFHANVCAINTALEQAPEILKTVRMYPTVNIFDGMIYNLMGIVTSKATIAKHLVRVEGRARLHVPFNLRLHSLFLSIRKVHSTDLAAALQQPKGDGFPFSARTSDATLPRTDVHVASLTTNEGLIDLNFTAKRTGHILVHGLADAVHHEPSRLLGNADSPGYLAGANSVLAVANHPERAHPLIKAKRRILKDGSHLERELLFAPRAEPNAASLDKGVFLGTATRARNNAVWPAKIQRVLKAAVGIAEINNRVLKSLRRVHESNLRRLALCVKYIITLIWTGLKFSRPFGTYFAFVRVSRRGLQAGHLAFSWS
jgi:hypothetical protein